MLSHMAFQSQLQRALARLLLASSAWAKEAYGSAIAHQRAGAALLKSLPNDAAAAADIKALKEEAAAALKVYERDNASIYYDAVPPAAEALPDGALLVKAEAYLVPPLVAMRFRAVGRGEDATPAVPDKVVGDLSNEVDAKLSTKDAKR